MGYPIPIQEIIDLIAEEIPLGQARINNDYSLTEWVILVDCKGNYGEFYIPKDGSKIRYEYGYDGAYRRGQRKNTLVELLLEYDKKQTDCTVAVQALIQKYGLSMVKNSI